MTITSAPIRRPNGRARTFAALAAPTTLFALQSRAGVSTWTGDGGDWLDVSHWLGDIPLDAATDAVIGPAATPSRITVDLGIVITGSMTLGAGRTLSLNSFAGQTFWKRRKGATTHSFHSSDICHGRPRGRRVFSMPTTTLTEENGPPLINNHKAITN